MLFFGSKPIQQNVNELSMAKNRTTSSMELKENRATIPKQFTLYKHCLSKKAKIQFLPLKIQTKEIHVIILEDFEQSLCTLSTERDTSLSRAQQEVLMFHVQLSIYQKTYSI